MKALTWSRSETTESPLKSSILSTRVKLVFLRMKFREIFGTDYLPFSLAFTCANYSAYSASSFSIFSKLSCAMSSSLTSSSSFLERENMPLKKPLPFYLRFSSNSSFTTAAFFETISLAQFWRSTESIARTIIEYISVWPASCKSFAFNPSSFSFFLGSVAMTRSNYREKVA